MHIQLLTGALLGENGESSPVFFKYQKNDPILKKGSGSVHLWVEFSIQIVAFKVSRRKKFQNVSQQDLFTCVFDKIFI